jgi:hypothetical protein
MLHPHMEWVLEMVQKVEEIGRKIFMDYYFTFHWSTSQESKCIWYSSSQQEGDAA